MIEITVVPGEQLTAGQLACWSSLQRADPALRSPFFRPEYTQAVAALCAGVEVAIVEEGGETVGFLPFQRGRWGNAGPVGGSLSDFQGLVARKGVTITAERLLKRCRLKAWSFDHLIASQELFRPYHCVMATSPYVDLSSGFEAYKAEQRKKGSQAIRKTQQKARKAARELGGPIRLEPHTADEHVLAKLIDWKVQQYRRLKDVNYLAPDWTKALLKTMINVRSEAFAGMLSALYVGDRLAAAHLGIRSFDVLHAWFPAYDPALFKYSPGLILWIELMQRCADVNIRRIDLGKGDQRFKTSFMSGADQVAEGCVDLRRLRRSLKRSWLHTREWIRSTPLRASARVPARMLRRFQAWLASH